MTADAVEQFSAEFRGRLGDHSGRALAAKTHWGRTVVNDIRSGRRLPTERQLRDLLGAVGASEAELASWSARLRRIREEGEPEPPAEAGADQPAIMNTASAGSPDPSTGAAQLDTSARTGARGWGVSRIVLVVAIFALVLIGAALLIVGLLTSTSPSASDNRQPAGQPPLVSVSPSGSATPPPTAGSIDTPADGTAVSSRAGVELTGTLQDDGVSTFWLVDHDSEGVYTADEIVTRVGNNSWKGTDQPIGDAEGLPYPMTILLVRANDACSTYFNRVANSRSEGSFTTMPKSCSIVDRLLVNVTRP